MNGNSNRRQFLSAAAGIAAMAGSARVAGGAKRGMYVSLNGALFNWKLQWPEFAHMAAKTGYPGADVNLGQAMKEGLEATTALLKQLKLKPAVVGLPVQVTRGDDAAFQGDLAKLPEASRFAAGMGCPRMTLVLPASSQTPKDELRKMLKDRIMAVAEILARDKVRLGLEFLGPLHLRSRGHEFIWRMDETLEYAKECGPNVGLLLDAWHWHHAGATVADILAAGKSRIVTIHVSDAAKIPPEEVKDNQRLMPGEGVIDLVSFFRALKKVGYEDGISPEVLGRIPADMPQEEAARFGLKTTLAVMRKAGVA